MRATHLEATEHEIMTLIANYLRLKGWYCMRLNSGMIPMTDYRGRKRMIMMGERGTPDLMAFRKSTKKIGDHPLFPKHTHTFDVLDLLFIEVKRKGKKPTWNQEQKMKELEEYGARCIVATGIEDLEGVI